MNLPAYWCPICHVPVATATIREVHTGVPGETVHNHRCHVQISGRWRMVDHTVITRQDRAVAA